jgi:hypothetical protein
MKLVSSVVAVAFLVGCGGDDGAAPIDAPPAIDARPIDAMPLDGTRPVTTLTPAELQQLCMACVDAMGGPGVSYPCGKNSFVDTGTYAQCVTAFQGVAPSCALTVDQTVTCGAAIAVSPCTFGDDSESCMALHACF